jgi:hypothetical protein
VSGAQRLARVVACLGAAAGVSVVVASIGYALSVSHVSGHAALGLAGNAWLSLSFMVVGLLLALRRPKLPIGWLLLLAGVSWSSGCLTVWPHHLVDTGQSIPTAAAVVASADTQWAWPLAVVPAIQLPLLLLPDGRLRSPRWRPVATAALVAMIVAAGALALDPAKLPGYNGLANPMGIRGAGAILEPTVGVAAIVLLAIAVIGVVGLVREYRRSAGVERQQLKWIAAGGAAAVVGISSSVSNNNDWLSLVTTLGLVLVPITIAVAVLRYRLYDFGRVISRTVTYALLTAMLIGVYVAIVALVGLVAGGGSVGIAAGTLVAAAAFHPLRRRLQSVVDQRFNRARYDLADTVESFARRLRTSVDLEAVTDDLLRVVGGVVEPHHLSLWLPSDGSRSAVSP